MSIQQDPESPDPQPATEAATPEEVPTEASVGHRPPEGHIPLDLGAEGSSVEAAMVAPPA